MNHRNALLRLVGDRPWEPLIPLLSSSKVAVGTDNQRRISYSEIVRLEIFTFHVALSKLPECDTGGSTKTRPIALKCPEDFSGLRKPGLMGVETTFTRR